MTESGLASDSTDAAISNLRASGYQVLVGNDAKFATPNWLKRFEPDLIAQRDEEFIVVEVQARRATKDKQNKLAEMAAEIAKHPAWGLELVWLGNDEVPASIVDVDALIARAENVLQVDVEAALLLIWPAVEVSLRLLASRVGIRNAQAQQLLSELYSFGWLSERHFQELEAAQDLRNAIAHHVGENRLDDLTVLRLAAIARRLADPQYVSLDQMVEWFRDTYMDPANGVPFNSREGGYLYINGGPYDALEVLAEQYPDALPGELDEAVEVLEQESHEWVRHDEY